MAIRKVVDLQVVCKGFVYVKNNGWNTDLYMSVVHYDNNLHKLYKVLQCV